MLLGGEKNVKYWHGPICFCIYLYLYILDLFISHHGEMDLVKSAAFHAPKCGRQQHNVTGIHLAVVLFGARWFMLEIVIFCALL